MSRSIYSSVDQICYTHCLQVTPHDLYSKCRVCGNVNQEKKSPADYEKDKQSARMVKAIDSWDYGM